VRRVVIFGNSGSGKSRLAMLIEWISQYYQRDDEFSHHSHLAFFNRYTGHKTRLVENISTSVD
jgi:ABC-type lipoprotein export system ATPase subunit